MQLTTIVDAQIGMTQIDATHADFPGRSAVLTRFKGTRHWSVVGFATNHAHGVHCYNGSSDRFTKQQALRMAEVFVTTGREFL